MQAEEYERMYRLEDTYWWFVARRNLALGMVSKFNKASQPKIVDLGCGTGVVLQNLGKLGYAVGIDMSTLALERCHSRGIEGLCIGDGTQLPVATAKGDVMVGLDVFEHIEGDEAAFAEAFRILKPGGILVMSVPAFKSLWGPHDVALMHFRRYTKGELGQKLEKVGFKLEKLSYSIFFLFPIVVLVRFVEKRKQGPAEASLAPLPAWLNSLLIGIQKVEHSLLQVVNLPWGSSVVAVARKPEQTS